LNVTGHDCDSLGVQATQVGVLEQLHQVILRGILQRLQRARLPPESGGRQVHAHLAGGGRGEASEGEEGVAGIGSGRMCRHLSNNSSEGQLAQEELGGLLKVPNLSKRTHAGTGAAFFYGTPCANVSGGRTRTRLHAMTDRRDAAQGNGACQ
jgi:hypothetical protein